MEDWPDAYIGMPIYRGDGYYRIPIRDTHTEPMYDYDYADFLEWLEYSVNYWGIIRRMQKRRDARRN
jgi:hypothetical protein